MITFILKEECVGVVQAEKIRSFPRKGNCVSQCLGTGGQKSKTYSGSHRKLAGTAGVQTAYLVNGKGGYRGGKSGQ